VFIKKTGWWTSSPGSLVVPAPDSRTRPRATPEVRGDASLAIVERGDAYLPLKALAAYSGLSVRTLRTYLTDPVAPLPFYRVGVKILVRRSEFDAWAQRFRVERPGTNISALVDHIMDGMK
jgi:hypothetical protein